MKLEAIGITQVLKELRSVRLASGLLMQVSGIEGDLKMTQGWFYVYTLIYYFTIYIPYATLTQEI